MWDIGQQIGDAEGRLDVCVAAAGILKASPVGHTSLLQRPTHAKNLTVPGLPHRGLRQNHSNQRERMLRLCSDCCPPNDSLQPVW